MFQFLDSSNSARKCSMSSNFNSWWCRWSWQHRHSNAQMLGGKKNSRNMFQRKVRFLAFLIIFSQFLNRYGWKIGSKSNWLSCRECKSKSNRQWTIWCSAWFVNSIIKLSFNILFFIDCVDSELATWSEQTLGIWRNCLHITLNSPLLADIDRYGLAVGASTFGAKMLCRNMNGVCLGKITRK